MSMNRENKSERQRCTATKADGTHCTAFAVLNGLCIGHQPNAGENRTKGGYNSSTKVRAGKKLPLQIKHIVILLEKAMVEVYQGNLPMGRGQAMASLGNAIVKAYEAGILEERLTALEKKVGAGDGK